MHIKHRYERLVNVNFILPEKITLTRLEAKAENENTSGDHDISIISHSHALNLCEDTKINFHMTHSSLEL